MKIEETEVYGFGASIRSMRNPMDSWDRSDSRSGGMIDIQNPFFNIEGFMLGDADKKLSQKLTRAGSEHCKHLRLITVWFDITAPRFWYQEFDTYKHKENVSCSTMHRLMSKPINESHFDQDNIPASLIDKINTYIELYKQTTDKEEKNAYLLACKNILPEGFLQKRTVCTNYQALYAIYHQRKSHRLPQWHYFCDWIKGLPYFIELTELEGQYGRH